MKKNLLLIFIGISLVSCMKKKVDLLVYNGKIYTVDSVFTIAEAMVADKGKIVAVGDKKDLLNRYNAREIIDLKHHVVLPGLIDAHCHFYGYGLGLRQADLTGTRSVDQIIDRLKMHPNEKPATWLTGRGWDQNNLPGKEYPHRAMLDVHFPDIPVYLIRIDGHAVYLNSLALRLAGITGDSTINGGDILTDADGPTGILIDNAIALAEKHIPLPGKDEAAKALMDAQRNCFAVGLTTVADAGLDRDIVLLIDSLQQEGELKMRIYAMLNPTNENLEYFVKEKEPYRTSSLTVRSIKLYADGALGSRGALLLEPYADDPGNFGLGIDTEDYYHRICRIAFENGFQVNTHCIGDAAVRLMLSVYGAALKGNSDLRWRIEHAQVVQPSDLSLFTRFSVVPSVQTTHATSDMSWAAERLGPHRVRYAYAYKDLLNCLGWLPNGSDFPVESVNPLLGFYAAVTRKDPSGDPPHVFQPENALSREEALRAMTIWAAKACFEEHTRGSLETGKMADFVVLDRDIMTADQKDLPGTRVMATFVNGEMVFEPTSED